MSAGAEPDSLIAASRLTWSGGRCTDTGIYYGGSVTLPLLEMYGTGITFTTGRVNARAEIPHVLALPSAGMDLHPVVESVAPWEDAPTAWRELRGKTVITR